MTRKLEHNQPKKSPPTRTIPALSATALSGGIALSGPESNVNCRGLDNARGGDAGITAIRYDDEDNLLGSECRSCLDFAEVQHPSEFQHPVAPHFFSSSLMVVGAVSAIAPR